LVFLEIWPTLCDSPPEPLVSALGACDGGPSSSTAFILLADISAVLALCHLPHLPYLHFYYYTRSPYIKFSPVVLYHPKTLGAARLESSEAGAITSTAVIAASINDEVERRCPPATYIRVSIPRPSSFEPWGPSAFPASSSSRSPRQ